MITGDFITRLKTQCPSLKSRVFGSIELSSATPTSMQMPCAFVVPMAEKAEGNMFIDGIAQQITAQIGVVVCVKNVKDDKGEGGHIELDAIRNEIRSALCGFSTNEFGTVKFNSGQIAAYDGMHIRWNDIFTTQFFFSN